MHLKYIPLDISKEMQHYTFNFFLENSSKYFRLYLHPSSGAHTNCI